MMSFPNPTNSKTDQPDLIQSDEISALIADLNNHDGFIRHKARIELVNIGEPAVDALIQTLNNRKGYAHWEAAKALSQIGSAKATQTLVKALEDDRFSVRWLAAEGLIAIGRDGLVPLLKALEYNAASIRLREGAHHVLHDLVRRKSTIESPLKARIRPVLSALNGIEPAVAVPPAVYKALQVLTH